jgi:glycosyltransferase involved in cell wall biosynthesis
MEIKKLSIIIPCFNEGPTIYKILDKIKAVTLINSIEKEIVIVNDSSTDNTAESVKSYIENNSNLNIVFWNTIKTKEKVLLFTLV